MNGLQTTETKILDTLNEQIQNLIISDKEIKTAILQNPEYVKKLLQENIIDELKTDIAQKKAVLRYDFKVESEEFLKRCRLQSIHTAKAYKYALNDFSNWMQSEGNTSPFSLTPELADAYIYNLRSQFKAAATIRQYIGGLAAFFNSMERKSNYAIKNCFRGTRALPKKKAVKRIENEIPTENLKLFQSDITTIIDSETDPAFKILISMMAFRGLRAGSFENMSFHGKKFFTTSKGKDISGEIPETCIELIEKAGLKKNQPFTYWSTARVSSTFQYHVNKLYKTGKISYKYSAHDLRHFFALNEYSQHKDIYALKEMLHHSSIAVTEIYLQGLGVDLQKR